MPADRSRSASVLAQQVATSPHRHSIDYILHSGSATAPTNMNTYHFYDVNPNFEMNNHQQQQSTTHTPSSAGHHQPQQHRLDTPMALAPMLMPNYAQYAMPMLDLQGQSQMQQQQQQQPQNPMQYAPTLPLHHNDHTYQQDQQHQSAQRRSQYTPYHRPFRSIPEAHALPSIRTTTMVLDDPNLSLVGAGSGAGGVHHAVVASASAGPAYGVSVPTLRMPMSRPRNVNGVEVEAGPSSDARPKLPSTAHAAGSSTAAATAHIQGHLAYHHQPQQMYLHSQQPEHRAPLGLQVTSTHQVWQQEDMYANIRQWQQQVHAHAQELPQHLELPRPQQEPLSRPQQNSVMSGDIIEISSDEDDEPVTMTQSCRVADLRKQVKRLEEVSVASRLFYPHFWS